MFVKQFNAWSILSAAISTLNWIVCGMQSPANFQWKTDCFSKSKMYSIRKPASCCESIMNCWSALPFVLLLLVFSDLTKLVWLSQSLISHVMKISCYYSILCTWYKPALPTHGIVLQLSSMLLFSILMRWLQLQQKQWVLHTMYS